MERWEEAELPPDGKAIWAGMADYLLLSPDRKHQIQLRYEGEPPHGDSYHRLSINGKAFPGYAWGCMFAASRDSRYLVFSWMERRYERKTVVVDLNKAKYAVLPEYIYNFVVDWPRIIEVRSNETALCYEVSGDEHWSRY